MPRPTVAEVPMTPAERMARMRWGQNTETTGTRLLDLLTNPPPGIVLGSSDRKFLKQLSAWLESRG